MGVKDIKYILTHNSFYEATDEEIMKHDDIRIAYGSNTYDKRVSKLNEIFRWIKEDYPNIKEEDIEIRVLTRNDSIWFAYTLILEFVISAEEFIRLRNLGKIWEI